MNGVRTGMKNQTTEEKKEICVFPTKTNPPHFGLMRELATLHNQYEKIYIAYCGDTGLLSPKTWASNVLGILEQFTDKYSVVMGTKKMFTDMQEIPKVFQELGVTKIVTTSNTIFVQCQIHHINAIRLRKAPGYYDLFQQNALSKGFVLDRLRQKLRGK